MARFTRLGQRHPWLVDSLVGATWLLLSSPTLLLSDGDSSATAQVTAVYVLLVLIVAAALVVLRRRRPVLAFAISYLATLPLVIYDLSIGATATAFCVFAIAVYDSPRRAWFCAAISAATVVVVVLVGLLIDSPVIANVGDDKVVSALLYVVINLLMLLVALLWGQSAGGRARYIESLLEHARALEHERDQQAQLAALAERSRIARDIHDIVAHSLSVIVRLADGAQAVLEDEPLRARSAIGELGAVARSSLTEMRRVMGVLEAAPAPTAPQYGAGFDDLPHLVEVYRGIGLPVELTLRGGVPAQPGVQMTVFRVIQEALTNALRHASDPTSVTVDVVTGNDVVVSVVSDGADPSASTVTTAGRGLVGMRERAALYGGTATAAADGDGRWVVHLVLPGAGG